MPISKVNVTDKLYVYQVKDILRKAGAVCFDVDSTVIRDEGIIRLAEACGKEKDVQKITDKAMTGGMNYKESLRARLNIINPSLSQVEELRSDYMDNLDDILTPKVKELVSLLHDRHITVYLISGGFSQLIQPIAHAVGISTEHIYCNELVFDDKGNYNGFREDRVTCNNGGKALAMQDIKQYNEVTVMIGDGMTDYEACPPGDAFIGFGGNVVREKVKEVAPWYVHDMQEIIDALEE